MNIIAVFSEMHEPGPYVIGEALKHCLGTCAYRSGSEFRLPACVIEPSVLLQKEKLEEMYHVSIATDPLSLRPF